MEAPEDEREQVGDAIVPIDHVRQKLAEFTAQRPSLTSATVLARSPTQSPGTTKQAGGESGSPHHRVLRSHFLKHYNEVSGLLTAAEAPTTAETPKYVSDLQAELAAAKADKERLQQQVVVLQGSHLAQLETQVSVFSEQLHVLQDHVTRLAELPDAIPSRMSRAVASRQFFSPTDQTPGEVQTQIDAVRSACDDLEDKLESLNLLHSGRAEEIVSLKRHVEKHWAELDVARQMIAKQVQIAAIQGEQLTRVVDELKTLTEERDALSRRVIDCEAELAKVKVKR